LATAAAAAAAAAFRSKSLFKMKCAWLGFQVNNEYSFCHNIRNVFNTTMFCGGANEYWFYFFDESQRRKLHNNGHIYYEDRLK
jgi:hypothetical protein